VRGSPKGCLRNISQLPLLHSHNLQVYDLSKTLDDLFRVGYHGEFYDVVEKREPLGAGEEGVSGGPFSTTSSLEKGEILGREEGLNLPHH